MGCSIAARRVRHCLTLVAVLLAAGALASCGGEEQSGDAAGNGGERTSEVVVGAAWPLSGPFAFNGKAVLAGAEAAVTDINAAGGIKALDGARIRLESVDVGGTPEEATSAVDRLLSQNSDIVGIAGSWLSSLTLAATEVSERQGVPYVSESFADDVTDREGFTHVFSYAPPSSQIQNLLLDSALPSIEEAGIQVQRAVVIGDNTAAATPLQDALAEALPERGIEVVARERWAPPLQDASGVVQKVAQAEPDAVFLIGFSFNDVSSVIRGLRSRGIDAPIIQNGGQAIVPQWRDLGETAEGLASFVYTNPLKKSEDLSQQLAEKTNNPYVWQDQLGGYFAIQTIAAGLEEAGKADRQALTDALHRLQLQDGTPVELMPTDTIDFNDKGRIEPAFGVLAQWQTVGGEMVPCTVYPAEHATCEPRWR